METEEKPWYTHLTIDLIARVLERSVFHPFIAWIVPLCLRATTAPYNSPQFIGASIYATIVTGIWLANAIDQRIAYGLPRELVWDDEVVVITGGASGLGRILAQTYGMRGASVAVLDVQVPDEKDEVEGLAGIKFYRCDVSDVDAVEEAKKRIEEDVRCHHLFRFPSHLSHPLPTIPKKPQLPYP